jgi:ABC-2 type transport system permease protein
VTAGSGTETAPFAPRPGAAPLHRMVLSQTGLEIRMVLRNGEQLLLTVFIPVLVLVLFSSIEFMNLGNRDRRVDFLVPGVLALAVMSTAMVSLGIATGFERRYGVLKRLGSTPLSRSGLLAAKTANVLAVEVLQAVLIIGTGIALGWHATSGILPALGLLLIGTVAFAGIGMLMAGTLRAEANLAAANGLFLVLLFLGGMAYPLDKLPDAIEVFAKALPAAALAECVRGVLASPSHLPVGELFVLLAWAVAAPLLAIRFFRWEE